MTFVATILDSLRARRQPVLTELTPYGPLAVDGPGLLARVCGLRRGLRARGLERGDRVAVVGANSIAWVATDLALLAEGLVPVPLYPRAQPSELAFCIEDSGASLVLVDLAERMVPLREAGVRVPMDTWGTLLQDGAAIGDAAAPLDPTDVATFCYTSGTSGQPKAALITVDNVDAMLPVTSNALAELMGGPPEDDRALHYLPFGFMGSRIVLWTALWRGTPLWLNTDLDRLLDDFAEAAPHWCLNVPLLLERVHRGAHDTLTRGKGVIGGLYETGLLATQRRRDGESLRIRERVARVAADRIVFRGIRRKLGPNLRFLICGSAPLPEDTARWFEAIGVPVYQVYGLTETTAILSMDRPDQTRVGTVGFAIDGCEVRVSPDGELQARGRHIFAGYHQRPEATEDAFTEDDWFRTGDLADVDRTGRITVHGRAKHVVVLTSGHNVVPEAVEHALGSAVPEAAHIVVLGQGRESLGALFFGPVDEGSLAARIAAVNETQPHYKRVRAWHVEPEPLTDADGLLTANGKLRRHAIAAHHAVAIQEMYAR